MHHKCGAILCSATIIGFHHPWYFSKIKNNYDPYVYCIKDPTWKEIVKYTKHSGIVAIRKKYKNKDSFSFSEVEKKETEKKILNLDVNKASKRKENIGIFCDFACTSFSNSIKSAKFPGNLIYIRRYYPSIPKR